jgi:hypothetical protein
MVREKSGEFDCESMGERITLTQTYIQRKFGLIGLNFSPTNQKTAIVLSRLKCASFPCPKALGKGAIVPEKRIQLISENRPRLKRRQLGMKLSPWTKKKTLITLTIIATLATTTIILATMNNTTQASARLLFLAPSSSSGSG